MENSAISANEDLSEYRIAVEYLAENNVSQLLFNSGPEHSLIIFENIFKNAKEHIRIAAKNLCNQEVTERYPYISGISKFLSRENVQLDIMLTDYDPIKASNSLLFDTIRKYISKGVKINIKSSYGKLMNLGKEVHLCTGDKKIYRIETDIVERKAMCDFNDENTTKLIIDIFDLSFSKSKIIEI